MPEYGSLSSNAAPNVLHADNAMIDPEKLLVEISLIVSIPEELSSSGVKANPGSSLIEFP